jgi:hypothetical protein
VTTIANAFAASVIEGGGRSVRTQATRSPLMRSNFLVVFLAATSIAAQAQSPPPSPRSPLMTAVARGEFAVKLSPLPFEGQPEGGKMARMSIDKTISGDLVATTKGQMLSAMTEVKGSAGYVAMEKVEGTLGGKKGSFVLQHTGTMNQGSPSLSVTVVPDSGTDELVGLAGQFSIIIAGGKHNYEFTYTLP